MLYFPSVEAIECVVIEMLDAPYLLFRQQEEKMRVDDVYIALMLEEEGRNSHSSTLMNKCLHFLSNDEGGVTLSNTDDGHPGKR